MVAKDKLLAEGGLLETKSIPGLAFQLQDTHHFPPRTQVHCMDSNSKNDYLEMHLIERPWHNQWTNGTRGSCDPLGLPFPQSSQSPSLLKPKSMLHHNQQHMHERFGFNERDSGKSKQGN
jgi:hypothetical protein